MSALEVRAAFHVPAEVLYGIFTSEREISRLSRSPASLEPKEGGLFSFFGGSVTGKIVSLEVNRCIVQSWRFSSWECDSEVVIRFVPRGVSGSELVISQSGIPAKDRFGNVDQDRLCRVGWEERWIGGLTHVIGLPLDK